MAKKRFSDINLTCYKISVQKEIVKRHLQNALTKETFAKDKQTQTLPVTVFSFRSNMIKRAPGVDLTSQYNKAENIRLACERINGIVIHPSEVFSFWKTVGKTTRKKGYKDGRVIISNKLTTALGGGLCNLGNSINRIILHSPLTVTEFHKHSDALAPDEGERIPLSAGTSVSYNYVDYRFRNDTQQDFQLLMWCDGEDLCGELRTTEELPCRYHLTEEDHHFRKEGDVYFRVSKLYRVKTDRQTNEVVEKTLVWNNHSEVMFDYALIPKELIRDEKQQDPAFCE